ncbi:hypothetical protein LBMAG42_36040 [Deltaproteobacteria bacterium]|nr:hypothetical protein LBMAG42_36040 [Deltaproteobacteria bacterium]
MLALLALVACDTPTPDGDSGNPASTADVVWYGDVEPIVEQSCTGCHVEGGVGGFALDSYASAAPMAAAMAASVQSRRMPPWKAEPGCTDYRDDISLTDEEIARLAAWAEEGAAEGDSGASIHAPPPVASLSRVDETLTLPLPYTPTATPDDYRCFLVDWPVDHTTHVTGYLVHPGAPSIVHHLVAYIAEPDQVAEYEAKDAEDETPGWGCFGGPGVGNQEDASWLGAWAPGATNGDFPNGAGIRMKPGSKVVLQMHYNLAQGDIVPDQTTMDIRYDDDVEAPAYIQPWADPAWLDGSGMNIPAGAEGKEHSFSYTLNFGIDVTIHTANLHMHKLGRTGNLTLEHSDGSDDCLLDIQDWDFNWQRTYVFEEPKTIFDGDTVTVTCTWDNPGEEDVNWGEGTGDEMCLGTMLFSY